MKKLLTMLVAFGLAVSFMTPTFAAAPKTKAGCGESPHEVEIGDEGLLIRLR